MKAKLLGSSPIGQIFIVSAPAGTGKTTLVEMLTEEFPEQVVKSISYTTRKPRAGEVDGVDYHFITEQDFEKKVQANEFLEHVALYGFCYGTSLSDMQAAQKQGKHVVLVIDTQGALQLKGKLDAVFIFLKPPSLDALYKRLVKRKAEGQEQIERRLSVAKEEIEKAKFYDYCIVNDDLAIAYDVLRSIIIAEEHANKIYNHFD